MVVYDRGATDGLLYAYDPSTATLTVSQEGAAGTEVKDLRNGYLAVMGGSHQNRTSTIHFVVSEGITNVCSEAFSTYQTSSTMSLRTVTLASTVSSIENTAFYGCSALESVTISANAISIGSSSFSHCTSLTDFPMEKVTSIGDSAFNGCTNLSSFTIPSSWTSIPDMAFQNCTSLLILTVPSTVSSIGVQAFYHCTGLTSVTIPYPTIPAGFTIGTSAFAGCASLTTLHFLTGSDGETNVLLSASAFSGCSALKRVDLPNGLRLGQSSFANCTSLEAVLIPLSVLYIPEHAFDGCTSLKSVSIPDGHRGIHNHAFDGCTSLETVLIGAYFDSSDTSINISDSAFASCTALKEVRFAKGHVELGQYVFRGCTSLEKLYILDSSDFGTYTTLSFYCGYTYNGSSWEKTGSPVAVSIISDATGFITNDVQTSNTTFTYQTYDSNAKIYSIDLTLTTGYDDPNKTIYPAPNVQLSVTNTNWTDSFQIASGYRRSAATMQIVPSVLLYEVTESEGNATLTGDTVLSLGTLLDRTPISESWPALFVEQQIGQAVPTSLLNIDSYNIYASDLTASGDTYSLPIVVTMHRAIRVLYTDDPEQSAPGLSIDVPDNQYYDYTYAATTTIVLPEIDPAGPYGVVSWAYFDTLGVEHVYPMGGYAPLDPDAEMGIQLFYGRWGLVFGESEIAAMMIFSAGGGRFDPDAGGISLITESGDTPIGEVLYDPLKKLWVWFTTTLDSTQDVTIKLEMPMGASTGLIPPTGMGNVRSWYVPAPYFDGTPAEDTRIMEYTFRRRPNGDYVRRMMYPLWTPVRRETQSAILVTPGYGSIDLGNIQSISETYSATLASYPIVCYGYSGAFCMDLGVEKDVEINFVRTCPPPSKLDDSSGDSRDWSTAHWISFMKTLIDRWQMMTNGSLLYLLRPRSERLHMDGAQEDDPMNELYTEIVGEHCYLTQMPIIYSNTPQAISGTIPLAIGTVYPKSREAESAQVKFYKSADDDAPISRTYPISNVLLLPDPCEIWGGTSITDSTVITAWSASADGTVLFDFKTIQSMDLFLSPDDPTGKEYRIYAHTETLSPDDMVLVLTSKKYLALPNPGERCTVRVIAIGAGGGGGGASIPDYFTNWFDTNPNSTSSHGGGGGGSGEVGSWTRVVPGAGLTIQITPGTGGAGGASGYYSADTFGNKGSYHHASDGGIGSATTVTFTSADVQTYSALGGVGGNSGENGGFGGTGRNTGGAGGKGQWGDDLAQNGTDGGDTMPDSMNGGHGGYGANRYLGTYRGTVGGGGGGAAGYCPSGIIFPDNGNANGSNGNGASDPDQEDMTSAGYGAGGGGGGGRRDYSNGGPNDSLWGVKGYDGKPGGKGWAYIVISGGVLEMIQ